MNPVYTSEYVESVAPRHLPPSALHQKVGFHAIQLIRSAFDKATGYGDDMDEKKWLQRMIFLETVAGGACAEAGCRAVLSADIRGPFLIEPSWHMHAVLPCKQPQCPAACSLVATGRPQPWCLLQACLVWLQA
jgi:hypothetical protein